MKVLFYRYKNICEPDILDTFREFGISVTEMWHSALAPQEFIRNLSEFLINHPVDFLFSVNFFPLVSEVCHIFHLRYVSWSVDSPVMEYFSPSVKHSCNRIFLFDRMQFQEVQPRNPSHVFHLPLAANIRSKEDLFRRTADSAFQKYRSDISFVGSLYTEMAPLKEFTGLAPYTKGYIDGIMAAQETIYGYYFIADLLNDSLIHECKKCLPDFYHPLPGSCISDKEILAQLYLANCISAKERVTSMKLLSEHFALHLYTGSDTSALPQIKNCGRVDTLTEMPLVFRESKINLNITAKSIRSGLPLRIFDILSCGGFVLTNYQSEIADLFTPGCDLAVYESYEDLVAKTEYYLTHEEERLAIAQNGLETLRKHHTYAHRLEKMLSLAFEINKKDA